MKEQNVQTSIIYDDYISLKTQCGCYDHDLKITFQQFCPNKYWLTFDDTACVVLKSQSFWKRLKERIKIAFNVLFKGKCQLQFSFIFKSNKHIDQFMSYMNEAYSEIKKEKK